MKSIRMIKGCIRMIKGCKANESYDVIYVDSDEVGLYFLQQKELYLYEEKCGIKPKVLKEITAMIRLRYGPRAIISMESLECADGIIEDLNRRAKTKIRIKGGSLHES